MLIELDYETLSALESALIVAEVAKERDAKDWANIADSIGALEQSQGAKEMAAFCHRQAGRYRKALDALDKAKEDPGRSDTATRVQNDDTHIVTHKDIKSKGVVGLDGAQRNAGLLGGDPRGGEIR